MLYFYYVCVINKKMFRILDVYCVSNVDFILNLIGGLIFLFVILSVFVLGVFCKYFWNFCCKVLKECWKKCLKRRCLK